MLLKRSAKLIWGAANWRSSGVSTGKAIVDITPHVRLAWTWFGPTDTPTIAPQVFAGPAAYAQALQIHNPLTQRGPAFGTLKGKAVGPSASPSSLPYGPWREAAKHGSHVLALPIYVHVQWLQRHFCFVCRSGWTFRCRGRQRVCRARRALWLAHDGGCRAPGAAAHGLSRRAHGPAQPAMRWTW